MARQPSFISIGLHRAASTGAASSTTSMQSRDLLRSAHKSAEFRKEWGKFDQITDEIDPYLNEVAHVEDSGG
jgi:hypothetical protein